MERKGFYHIALFAGIGFICLMYLNVNSQTRHAKSVKSSVHAVPSKLTSVVKTANPKPELSGWYSGDMYVHRICSEQAGTVSGNNFAEMMVKNNLDVLVMLADMGNRELKENTKDLSSINGTDAKESVPGRIIHWDAEWRYKPDGVSLTDQLIGGHLALMGLKGAPPAGDKLPHKILEWAKGQNAVTGFVYMKYFNDSVGNNSNFCFPLDYSVEAALGRIDFVAENSLQNDAVMRSYYKLLNCGFRIGLAAGTDFSCNEGSPGDILTYVQVKDKPLTYEKWVEGIKKGRTVISLNGHNEFLDIKANGSNTPGDEIKIKGQGDINVMVRWTAAKEFTGRIELLCNGKVVATQAGTARPGSSVVLSATQKFIRSGWLAARRMDEKGHVSHTAPIYVTVDDQPIRASVGDAKYFISWIDHILDNISSTTIGNKDFASDPGPLKARYEEARDIYIRIQDETLDQLKKMGDGVLDNGSAVKSPVKKIVKHKSKSVRSHHK
jgi:hypothetical protein